MTTYTQEARREGGVGLNALEALVDQAFRPYSCPPTRLLFRFSTTPAPCTRNIYSILPRLSLLLRKPEV